MSKVSKNVSNNLKVICANAISVNGFIAREDGQEDFLLSDNWDDFLVDTKHFDNFVMGRETFELVSKLYESKGFDDVDLDFKLIVTRQANYQAPQGYQVVHSPLEALDFLKKQKIDTVLLVGGGKLNAAFFKANLVDELWLNVDPYLLCGGRPVFDDNKFESRLRLLSVEERSSGRVNIKYRVLYD